MEQRIRKRMKRWEFPGGVRFITFSCQRRLPLLRNPAISAVFVEAMCHAREAHGFELFAWVIMPEHVHILARPRRGETMDRALRSIKVSVAKRVVSRWKELNAAILARITVPDGTARVWLSGGGFDRNVRIDTEFCKEVLYIHRNPVARGLVQRPEDWKWSSARWWLGALEGEVRCDPPPGSGGGAVHWSDRAHSRIELSERAG
ncbi:MAG: transposase [Planctomycetes bacterium]|nr:transposase [Planctomycetota bacterium]